MAHKVTVARGERRGEVSRQWASRPDDQRFLTLDDLRASVAARAERSRSFVLDHRDLRIGLDKGTGDLAILAEDRRVKPTNWAFAQLTPPGVSTDALVRMPTALAAMNLQWGLAARGGDLMTYEVAVDATDAAEAELRAVTSPTYGRVMDKDVVDYVSAIVEATGGRWKVPGQLSWGSMRYDPDVPVTRSTTTLYASDRDVFMFLVDDKNPIEVGLLPDGSPDLMFRGFYVWNSEVGKCSAGMATMFLRAVCANRNLWGVEGFNEVRIVHNQLAPSKVVGELVPRIAGYAEATTTRLIEAVASAKTKRIGDDDEARLEFLGRYFPKKASAEMMALHLDEEARPVETIWDAGQAATAYARRIPHTDTRLAMEKAAKRIFDLAL